MTFEIFRGFQKLRYGFSQKSDGFMNLRPSGSPRFDSEAEENRKKFFEREGVKPLLSKKDGGQGMICIPDLTHSSRIAVVREENCNDHLEADGLVTSEPNLFLVITVADCFPVYFYDPFCNAIGLLHVGWRGLIADIVPSMIQVLKNSFSSNPRELCLALGPGIQKCHFTVRDDVIGKFERYQKFIKTRNGDYGVDLEGIIIEQAREKGVRHIESSGLCTFCSANKYFSYRREKPILKTMLAFIGQGA